VTFIANDVDLRQRTDIKNARRH